MKNKGFTLVELMAVIIILGIIGFISVPAFINSIKSNNIDSYNNIVNDIVLSAETYASNANGNLVQISVNTLQDTGYLKRNIINPVTDEMMNGCVYKVSGKTIYREESCSTYIEGLGPDNVCNYPIGSIWNYEYDPDKPYYTFNTPCSGTYKVELWGAEGGGTSTKPGGQGGYTKGNIGLNRNTNLYIYVGGVGPSNATTVNVGGYNGGGYSGNNSTTNSYGGGGATDIRLENGLWNNFDSLKSRIMVSAGGGGNVAYPSFNTVSGAAGGLVGYDASGNITNPGYTPPKGATQISGGIPYNTGYSGDLHGYFGYAPQAYTSGFGGGGGSGYFGGANGFGYAGSGGSSYISGHAGAIAITKDSTEENINQRTVNGTLCEPGTTDVTCSYHYSDYIFTDTVMIDGEGYNWTTGKGEYVGQTNPDSTSGVGHTGSGYARVTLVSTIAPQSNDITVRFDANGGTVNTVSKKVKYGGTYGNLPVPTREGYTFVGWNGKNILDLTGWLNSFNSSDFTAGTRCKIEKGNGSITMTAIAADCYTPTYYGNSNYTYGIPVKSNTTYTLSWESSNKNVLGIIYVWSNNSIGIGYAEQNNTNKLTFTTLSDTTFITFRLGVKNSGDTITYSNIQLEEGTESTVYEPFYITSSTPVVQSNNHTLTAIWEKKEATFINGTDFNIIIKRLAGNIDASYETNDTNIITVARSELLTINPKEENIVSSDDSNTPIYAWFDNGTLYYYSEANNLYAKGKVSRMFRSLTNVTSIDISTINFSKATEIEAMFYNDNNLDSIDFSNLSADSVTAITYLFAYCRKITSLDLSTFDFSKIIYTNQTARALYDMTSLQSIKTPKAYSTNSNIKISLPGTFYDSNGNAYTELDNTSPTNTLLFKPYIVTLNPDGGKDLNPSSVTVAGSTITSNLPSTTKTGYTFNGWKNILYFSDVEKTNPDSCTKNCEWLKYADLAPYIDKYGTDKTYHLELDLKSKNISNMDKIIVYFQNGSGSKYGFRQKKHVISDTEWTHISFDFTIDSVKNDFKESWLAFYGEYNTGNIPAVKNVELSILPDYTTSNKYADLFITGNPVNLKAKWSPNTYTVTLDAKGGNVSSTSKTLTYNDKYGDIPEPTKDGYTFDGWYIRYDVSGWHRKYTENNPVVRMAIDQSYKNSLISPGDIIDFDLTFNGANVVSVDVNDKTLSSDNYIVSGNNIKGTFEVTSDLINKNLSFVDVNFDTLPTSYTINKFVVTKNTNQVTKDTIVNSAVNHTLYAKWKYNITLDANGGSLSNTTYQVTTGNPYGNLPEPTRSGYTFKGWNGKNKLDISKSLLAGIRNEAALKAWAQASFDTDYIINNLSPSTIYTLSFDAECISIENYDTEYSNNLGFYFYSTKLGKAAINKLNRLYLPVGEKVHKIITFSSGTEIFDRDSEYNILLYTNRYTKEGSEVLGNIKFTNIQIEEGDVATAYEPYYIQSTTRVTQDGPHTLTAIWEPNS